MKGIMQLCSYLEFSFSRKFLTSVRGSVIGSWGFATRASETSIKH